MRRMDSSSRSFLPEALLGLMLLATTTARGDDPLAEVTRRIEGRTRRASSGLYDPESNRDAYHIGPGKTTLLTTLEGPGEIRHMWFTIAGKDRRYPRSLVLRIYWDGAEVPSVETPLGDFFAAGNGMRANVDTLPIQATSYGRALNCYWRMPFRRSARIEMSNEGENRLTVYWQFDWIELPHASDDLLYFHARYRQEHPAKPFSPYVIFEGRGRGHYVGTVFSIQCSYGSWFGESDDRFYIDGEVEPSIVGTGCEDFFNDAWNLRLFTNDNTGVTIKEPNGEDCRFTAYRWHLRAPVIFQKALKVDIERRSYALVTNPETGVHEHYDFKYRPDLCSSVAFWYQDTIAERTEPFPPVEERINPEIFLETTDKVSEISTSPDVRVESHSNRVCNLKRGLYVHNSKVGGWFEVPFHVENGGKHSISVFQCLYRTGGVWKVTLRSPGGGVVLDPAMDFYDPYLAWTENRPENFLYGTWFEKKLGIHDLPAGDYSFRFECVGAHPLSRAEKSAAPGYECRLDGISLRRFPWQDLYGQMREYLAEEERRSESMKRRASEAVVELAARVDRFRAEEGRYPTGLAELLGSADAVPLDPWGQRYRYDHPGVFHGESFDVYSVHGDSRDPAAWIGNWPTPYRIQGALEGESLRVLRTRGDARASEQEIDIASLPPLSRGRILFIRMQRPGDGVDLALPTSIAPGEYSLSVRLVTSWNYAKVKVSLNGEAPSATADTYSPDVDATWVPVGDVIVRPGDSYLRLEAVGRNAASTGHFAGVDCVLLSPKHP